jgi:hypothetical protein
MMEIKKSPMDGSKGIGILHKNVRFWTRPRSHFIMLAMGVGLLQLAHSGMLKDIVDSFEEQFEFKILPGVMIVYMSCNEIYFPIWKSEFASFQLHCHPQTNDIDCQESVPMLEFFMKVYDRPLARKYIFIHAHEKSRHYPRNVFDQIRDVVRSDYFRQNQYGAIFPVYNRGPGGGINEEMYRAVYMNTSMPPRRIKRNNFRPCCGTFFVDSDLIRTRKREEYDYLRSRLRQFHFLGMKVIDSPNVDCARVMEYTWHILLTNRTYIPPLPKSV